MKRLLTAIVLAITALVLLVPTAMASQPANWVTPGMVENPNTTNKLTLLLKQANDFDPVNAVNDGIYIAAKTDKYFQGGVEAGMEALLEAGRVYVNGIRVPANPALYYMNGMPAIWYRTWAHDWAWQAHDKLNKDTSNGVPAHSFEAARRQYIRAVSGLRGMTTSIYALPGQTKAWQVNFSIKSAAQAEWIKVNPWGTVTIWGVPVDATSYRTDGGPNRWETRSIRWGNYDWRIRSGDTVLYWYDRTGWHMQRCVPVTGLMTATDTNNINVNGVTRSDALIVRYNMQAGSRPGQVVRAVNNLQLGDVPVTLWNTDTGHVVGISHGQYARTALYAGLTYVNAQLAGKKIVASADGSDVFAGTYWVTQAVLDAWNSAYNNAKKVYYNGASSGAQMDAATEALSVAFGTDTTKGMRSMKPGLLEEITYETKVTDGTTKVTSAAYDQYFGGTAGAALTGVQALLDAGKVYVNGLKVPATEGETTLYSMNAIDALWLNTDLDPDTWGYAVHKYVYNYGVAIPKGVTYAPRTFNQARLEMVENLSSRRGRTVKLTIDAATGQAIRIDLQELESVYIGAIETHGATTTINRSAYTLETGRYPVRFDVNGIFFDTSTVDLTVGVGDFAVWWLSTDGWHLKRCTPITGLLTQDASKYYHIGSDVRYEADCSRFNLATSVRPTQFYTSYVRLGLTGFEVTAWCMPDAGNPIGFTYGSDANAKNALATGIATATAAKTGVLVSAAGDGSDVPADPGTKWVTQGVMDTYNAAIASAQAVYDNVASVGINYTAAIYDLSNAMGTKTPTPSGFLGSVTTK